VGEAVAESVGRVVGRAQERRPLDSDLLESADAYLVVFDAPGVDAEDVQVRFEDGTVHVRLDRYRSYESGFEMRFPGRGLTLSGRRSLPRDAVVEPAAADATVTEHGTLEVRLPKAEAASTSTAVPVTAEEGADDAGSDEPDGGAAEDGSTAA
jgi:HSP20 family molecular chaperone IbpA